MSRTRRGLRLAAVAAPILVVAMVGSALGATWTASISGASTASISPATAAPWPTPIRHVIVIFFENAEVGTVMVNGTYERDIAQTYSQAGQFYSVEHYSLPNYEAATSGTASNLLSVSKIKNIGDLAQSAGRSWYGFFESMPAPCTTVDNGSYDIYHNPFLAYADIVNDPARCDKHVVSLTPFLDDLQNNTLPNYSFIAPNTSDDGHNTGVGFADTWLQGFLPLLLASPLFASTAIFLTYDEGTTDLGIHNSTGGGHIYLALVSPYARMGFNSSVQYDTYSLYTTSEWLLGLGRTGNNDNWSVNPPMEGLFDFAPHFPVAGHVVLSNNMAVTNAVISGNATVGTPVNPTNGRYLLWLANGTYSLTATAPGYSPVSIQVTVSGAGVHGARFTL